MSSPISLDYLKSLLSARQSAASRQAAGGDFAGLLASAGDKPDGKLLAQLANIMMLKSMSRLWSQENSSPASSPTTLPGLSAGLPASWQRQLGSLKAQPQTAPLKVDKIPTPSPAKTHYPASTDRQTIDDLIQGAARRHKVDPSLVRAVVTAESDFDPNTVSTAGAMGLMQLMPETASDLGVKNPFDPAQNIEAGTRYLAMMLERFDGDLDKALAAYNWGPSNVERGGSMPLETRNYLKKVARFQKLYTQGFSVTA